MNDSKMYVVKIGGAVLEKKADLTAFVQSFADARGDKVLVHGGGKRATALADDLGIRAPLVEGRRITDDDMLEVAVMVYAGLLNKRLVADLQGQGCNAMGLTGADGNLLEAHKRPIRAGIDYGWAGDIDRVNGDLLLSLIDGGLVPVVASITHDRLGQLLNTNADTIANEVAIALSQEREVHLIYLFEQPGVMKDLRDEESIIRYLDARSYQKLKSDNKIHSGMIPKLDNAFNALSKGVKSVRIGRFDRLKDILGGDFHDYTLINTA